MKKKHKEEKVKINKQLKSVEENYQKYAFFYTKYLEESIVFNERGQKITDMEKGQKELEEKIEVIKGVVHEVVGRIRGIKGQVGQCCEKAIDGIESLIIEKIVENNLDEDKNLNQMVKEYKHSQK